MNELKLFVWTNFCPDYAGGLAVALAADETEAREEVAKARTYDIYDWGQLTIYPADKAIAFCVSGGG